MPRLVNRKDNKNLTQRITLEELNSEVEDMEEDKALGPDRFSARFIKVCWDIVPKDLLKMVLKSNHCEKIGGNTNSTFVALIPKEKDVVSFDKFHPISLFNISYKIITKIMAKRLKDILY